MLTLAGIGAALRRVPREVWYVLAIGLAVWLAHGWYQGKLDQAFKDGQQQGAAAQALVDARAYTEAAIAAADAQQAVIDSLRAKQIKINERTTDALKHEHAALSRSYDDLRLRWAEHRKAHPGGAREGGASAIPGAAAGFDAAYCAAEGWVSFDVAAAAAEAADKAIAKDDLWIDWALEQQAAWPDS
jgi:hypothetical protein